MALSGHIRRLLVAVVACQLICGSLRIGALATYDGQQIGLKQPHTASSPSFSDRGAYASRMIDLRQAYPTSPTAPQIHHLNLGLQPPSAPVSNRLDAEVLTVEAAGNYPCRKSHGLEPVAEHCARFLNCVHGNGVLQQCGPGTVFNAELLVCDWPYNVDCGGRLLELQGGRYAIDARMADDDDAQTAATSSHRHEVHRTAYGESQAEFNRRTVPMPAAPGHELLPPKLDAGGEHHAAATVAAGTLFERLAANACGTKYPVIDGNHMRMQCVDQYGGHSAAGALAEPATTGPTTFAAVDAAGRMLETFVQTRQSNPCAGTGLKPVIDGLNGGVRCVVDHTAESVVVGSGVSVGNVASRDSGTTGDSLPNPCVWNELPTYEASINRIKCVRFGADASQYRTVRNPCGLLPAVYNTVSSTITCGVSDVAEVHTHGRHHLSTADQRRSSSSSVTSFGFVPPSSEQTVPAEPARGLQPPKFGSASRHREVEPAENDGGQITAAVPFDMRPRFDADTDDDDGGQRTQRVEYSWGHSSGSTGASHRSFSSTSESHNQRDVGQRTESVGYSQSSDGDQQHSVSAFSSGTGDDVGQRTQIVTYTVESSSGPTTDSQLLVRRNGVQHSISEFGSNVGDDVGQRTQSVTYTVDSASGPTTEPQFVVGRNSYAHRDHRGQQQQISPESEASALEESMRILDSYSSVRRQGHGRAHVQPIYDRLAVRTATSMDQRGEQSEHQQNQHNQQQNHQQQHQQNQQHQQHHQQEFTNYDSQRHQQQEFTNYDSQRLLTENQLNTSVLAESMRMLMKPYLRGVQLNVTEAPPQIVLSATADDDRQQVEQVHMFDAHTRGEDNRQQVHHQQQQHEHQQHTTGQSQVRDDDDRQLHQQVEEIAWATTTTRPPTSANQSRRRGDQTESGETTEIPQNTPAPPAPANQTTNRRPMLCPQDYWLCGTSEECLPVTFLCDGTRDCIDSTDEEPERCVDQRQMLWRLATVGGSEARASEGRVEVRRNGVWGTVCGDKFGQLEADVVCRSLGFSGRGTVIETSNRHSYRTDPIWLDETKCTGGEASLAECLHNTFGEHDCDHAADVSVRCATAATRPNSLGGGLKTWGLNRRV